LALPAAAQVNVIMQHNDRLRSGANLSESIILTPANVTRLLLVRSSRKPSMDTSTLNRFIPASIMVSPFFV
jgi:hypothetical protein